MLVDLEWLPPPPHDFRDRLRALQGELAGDIQPNFYERLVSLAATALSEAELARLAGLSRWIKDNKSRTADSLPSDWASWETVPFAGWAADCRGGVSPWPAD